MAMLRVSSVLLLSFFLAGCWPWPRQSTPSPLTHPDHPSPSRASWSSTPDLNGGPEQHGRVDDLEVRRQIFRQFPGIVFYHGPAGVKQAALTFDDGPDVTYTARILDILKREGVHATFFIVGQRAQTHPYMIRRIVQDGHVIGNHSWDHPDLTKLSSDQVKSEVLRTNQILTALAGYAPDLFRPPYGKLTPDLVQMVGQMGFKVIDWSVDTRDWAGTPASTILAYVRKEITPGGIILEHCAGGRGEHLDNTVEALPRIIAYLRSQGYSFVTIPQLLHVPATIGTGQGA